MESFLDEGKSLEQKFFDPVKKIGLNVMRAKLGALGTKLDMIFKIVSLKTETCSLTLRLLSKDSQWNRLMAFLYDQNLPGRNAKVLS